MYSYKFGGKDGKEHNLIESNDRVVVRTKNARTLKDSIFSEEGKKTLDNFNSELEFPEADVTVLKAKEEISNKTDIRDKARSILKNEEELRFAGRVLMDPDSKAPVLYTENLFIKFYDSVKPDVCEQILSENNLKIKQKLEYGANSYFVNAPENTGLKIFELAEALLNRNEVEFCHPEIIRKRSLKNININQWHLKSITINGTQIIANVNAEKAHLLSQGENIIIAIIDDGVDIEHSEFNLPGKVVSSRDATLNTNDPRPKFSDEKHGTACAGVATASGITASGVAPKSKLMPIRLASQLGAIAEANAFKWAVDHGADIISCSWGPEDGDWSNVNDPAHTQPVGMPDSTRLAIEDAVTRGRNGRGCVVTFAAGNGNEDIKFDGYASNNKVIAVAASNDTNTRSVYSDFGESVWCCFPSSDFGHQPFNHPNALTKGIFTTDRHGAAGYNHNGDYTDDFGGTSSSCPGIAGIAALILSANPDLTWQQVRNIIKDSCERIDQTNGQYGANGHSKSYGYGKPDAEKAVKRATEMKIVNNVNNVKIVSALVNPLGTDAGNEKISFLNSSASNINLTGWSVQVKTHKQILSGQLAAGETITVNVDPSKLQLLNNGATITLLDSQNKKVHEVTYKKSDVKEGQAVVF